MNKLEISISILTGLCLIGVIVLIGMDKDVSILSPVLAALIGWLLGKKQDMIISYIKTKIKK